MYTYLRIEELIQEGRELQWTATAFEDRQVGPELSGLFAAWVRAVREAVAGRAEPESGWNETPSRGREMARAAQEVLALLRRLAGETA